MRPRQNTQTITGIILAGGRGERMQGIDKPLARFLGRPIIEHVLERLQPQVDGLLISANRNLTRYQRWAPVVSDTLPDFQGPLAGLSAALQCCPTPWYVVVPGDGPRLPQNLVQNLWPHRRRTVVAVARCRQRLQPLYFLGHRDQSLVALERYLGTGRRSAYGYLESQSIRAINVGQPHEFMNLNRWPVLR